MGWLQTLVDLRQCPWLLYLRIIAVSYVWATDSSICISFHWKASSFFIFKFFIVVFASGCQEYQEYWLSYVSEWLVVHQLFWEWSFFNQSVCLDQTRKSITHSSPCPPPCLFFFFCRRVIISHKICRWYCLLYFQVKHKHSTFFSFICLQKLMVNFYESS